MKKVLQLGCQTDITFTKGVLSMINVHLKKIAITLLIAMTPALTWGNLGQVADDEGRDLSLIIDDEIKKCEGHFDVVPYVLLGYGPPIFEQAVEDGTLTEAQLLEFSRSWTAFSDEGSSLITDQPATIEAIECAAFAKGFALGGLNRFVISELAEVIGKAVEEAAEEMIEEAIEAIK